MPSTDPAAAARPVRSGLLASARRLLTTFAELLHTRAELLFTELEEEAARVHELLLYELASLFFLGLAVLLATLFVVMIFWDDHRQAVLGALTLLYLAIGVGAGVAVRRKLHAKPRLFSASLAELGKDCERLDAEL